MSTVTRSSLSRTLLGIAAIGLSTPLAGVGQTREIAFASSSAGVTLTGTITGPTAPIALAVLVSVAGPTDRDLTLGRHKYFERLADGLAEGGVATLRYDDRGVGGSGGSLGATDLSTRTADACEAIGALRSRYAGVDRVGVVGMSEGGGIALLASERCGPLSFAVLLSAPVRDGQTVMKGQVQRLLAAGSIPDQQKAEIEAEALRFLDLVAADQPEDNRGKILESVAQQVRDLVLGTGTLTAGEATQPAVGSFVLAQGGRVAREAPAVVGR